MPPVILDITRTLSRLTQSDPTGIDRVEAAYIDHFMSSTSEVYFLCRLPHFFYLLDRAGLAKFRDLDIQYQSRATADTRLAVFAAVRQFATIRFHPFGPIRRICKGAEYVNVGLSKLTPKFWRWLSRAKTRKIFMLHDMIPVDHPEFCEERITQRFTEHSKKILRYADHIVCNSDYTKARLSYWAKTWDIRLPEITALWLGVEPVEPLPRTVTNPNFVCIGTIEPRKNHTLLLDVWDQLPNVDAPKLHIVGRRGWLNEQVFARLDTQYSDGMIIEHGYVTDEALNKLLTNATAALFPSFAEGFGFPLVDAMRRGVPVVCSDIPVFREIGGEYPTFIDANDLQTWTNTIKELSGVNQNEIKKNASFPKILTWDEHFLRFNEILRRPKGN